MHMHMHMHMACTLGAKDRACRPAAPAAAYSWSLPAAWALELRPRLRQASAEMDELRSDVAAANGQIASLGAQLADSQSQKEALGAQLEAISGVATGRRLSQGGGSPGLAMRTASSPSAGGREDRAERERLREENHMLESQLSLLSEKMYGSPARGAAAQRDKLQVALEQEVAQRVALQREARVWEF
jgi:hypothetical protein